CDELISKLLSALEDTSDKQHHFEIFIPSSTIYIDDITNTHESDWLLESENQIRQ
ncbi:unnamed protein product, partial [Rotaria sp. Silwood1]